MENAKATSSVLSRAVWTTIFGSAWFFACIFIPAWTLNYWQGWVFFITILLSTCLATFTLGQHDTEVLERRMNMGPRAEKTGIQKIITALGAPLFIGGVAFMVLDHRFGWSPAMPGSYRSLAMHSACWASSCTSSLSKRIAMPQQR